MLKNDNGHMPYFPIKMLESRHDTVANFEPHLLHGSKMELDQTQRTHPAPQWLATGSQWKDSISPFSSTRHLLENH